MKIFETERGKRVFVFVESYTKIIHLLIQLLAILAMIALSFAGLYKLVVAFAFFGNIYDFLKELLHSLEILFIAPIPILIIYSYKKYVLALFNSNGSSDDSSYNIFEKIFNSNEAEKAFITSIIGITSTFILGLFIELLSVKNDGGNSINVELLVSNDFILTIVLAFVFLIIQLILFKLITKP